MIGDRYERWDGIIAVAGVSMELDAVGENSPHVQLDSSSAFVFSTTDGTHDVAQVHWMMDYFGVQRQQLSIRKFIKSE